MDNYPLGAAHDPEAPYNKVIKTENVDIIVDATIFISMDIELDDNNPTKDMIHDYICSKYNIKPSRLTVNDYDIF